MNIKSLEELEAKSDVVALQPVPGRFRLLSSDGNCYIYIPELQQIFRLKESYSKLLKEPNNLKLRVALRDLVANKIKTSQNKPPMFDVKSSLGLESVVIHVSQRCNLNCVYCYASDLNKVNEVMSFDVAEKIVPQTLSLSQEGLASVKFLGGEPTLAWRVVETLVNSYIDKSKEAGFSPPKFVMVTNGTRITNNIIGFASNKSIFTWVSLDGPKQIHDLLRPTLAGQGTYDKAVASVKRLINAGVRVGIEAVYTHLHYSKGITPQDLVNHFLSLGVREIQISPNIAIWHGWDAIGEIEQMSTLFAEAAIHSISSYRTGSPYLLRGIDFVIRGFIGQVNTPYVCGAGRTFMAINYDGEAFPCYLLESPSTSYGLVGNKWNRQRYKNVQDRFSCNGKAYYSECRQCWACEICKSCLGTSFQIAKEITKPPSWFCAFEKSMIEVVLAKIASISESPDWQLFIENISHSLQKNRVIL